MKLFIKYLLGLLFVSFISAFTFLSSCDSGKEEKEIAAYKQVVSNKLYNIRQNEDSLQQFLKESLKNEDEVAIMLTYKQLGSYQRENADFSNAIISHQNYFDIASARNDTLEIIQALNDLGTNFRRIGVLSQASDYHFQALEFVENYSKTNSTGKGLKCKVVTLNGIGNISLTLGFYDEAEKYFRIALEEEIKQRSEIGQGINYANIGAIFEYRHQYDSARVYFNKSMYHNTNAKSDKGIALCHIHLGDIFANEKNYDQAKAEYSKAYSLMESISDRWHWLEACISIAKINNILEEDSDFKKHIQLAEQTANQINSTEHLAKIYSLKHDFYLKKNNAALALDNYKHSIAMLDSLQGLLKTNHFLDMRVNFEREQNKRRLEQLELNNKVEQQEKQITIYISWFALLLGIILSSFFYYAYQQKRKSNILLKQLEKTRSEFFTNITHEFRTPLTVIKGLNEQLLNNKVNTEKEKKSFHAIIEKQSNNLLDLVNSLLDIAKIRSGMDNPEWRHGDFVAYMRMIVESYTLYAKEKNIEIIYFSNLSSQNMDFVPFYIDKIIGNLISNAIKHSQSGEKIHLTIVKDANNENITIRLSDNGEGISPENIDRIFDMFYQCPESKNQHGSGVGLAFTKLMIERMYGTIGVKSQIGVGTIFTVTLPIKNRRLTQVEPLQVQIIESDPIDYDDETAEPKAKKMGFVIDKPLVLLVEDNRDILLYLTSLLGTRYEIITAANGKNGLDMAEKYIPDLVVTDVMMPIKDGFEMCRDMKANKLLNHIPILILTARISDEDKIRGMKCGAESFIRKPFKAEELISTIQTILENRKLLREKYLQTVPNVKENEKKQVNENIKLLQMIADIIHSEITNPDLNTNFIADKLAMSSSQLNRKLNAISGYSTSSYIITVKLNKAKKMLRESNLNITEVSEACGFLDPSYFSRVFKKEFGVTPSKFQKIPETLMN